MPKPYAPGCQPKHSTAFLHSLLLRGAWVEARYEADQLLEYAYDGAEIVGRIPPSTVPECKAGCKSPLESRLGSIARRMREVA